MITVQLETMNIKYFTVPTTRELERLVIFYCLFRLCKYNTLNVNSFRNLVGNTKAFIGGLFRLSKVAYK